ncbi:MAG: GtrA family protein [Hyphomicrobiales bacterium]|nr:GtrA family protein [Hyphomicrobiales bacterium]
MTRASRFDGVLTKLADGWRNRALSLKAISFGLVGLVNTAVDYGVFLLARSAFSRSSAALAAFASASAVCQCGTEATILLIAANTASWFVAVTGSYVMNSSITFAAESGRKLRWDAYFIFVASGVAGWLANTATLLAAAEILLLPVWLAKIVAIMASFVVNFLLSHFVVFRVRKDVEPNPGATD